MSLENPCFRCEKVEVDCLQDGLFAEIPHIQQSFGFCHACVKEVMQEEVARLLVARAPANPSPVLERREIVNDVAPHYQENPAEYAAAWGAYAVKRHAVVESIGIEVTDGRVIATVVLMPAPAKPRLPDPPTGYRGDRPEESPLEEANETAKEHVRLAKAAVDNAKATD